MNCNGLLTDFTSLPSIDCLHQRFRISSLRNVSSSTILLVYDNEILLRETRFTVTLLTYNSFAPQVFSDSDRKCNLAKIGVKYGVESKVSRIINVLWFCTYVFWGLYGKSSISVGGKSRYVLGSPTFIFNKR